MYPRSPTHHILMMGVSCAYNLHVAENECGVFCLNRFLFTKKGDAVVSKGATH
jgi:hypothetical protein